MQHEWGGGADLFFARWTLGPQQPVAQDGAVRLSRCLPAHLDWGGWQRLGSEGLCAAGNLDCRSTRGQNALQSFCYSCDILLRSLLLLKHRLPLAFWPKAGQDPYMSFCVCVIYVSYGQVWWWSSGGRSSPLALCHCRLWPWSCSSPLVSGWTLWAPTIQALTHSLTAPWHRKKTIFMSHDVMFIYLFIYFTKWLIRKMRCIIVITGFEKKIYFLTGQIIAAVISVILHWQQLILGLRHLQLLAS